MLGLPPGVLRTLKLPLKQEYFEAIRDGTKHEEYRLVNEYWSKRLIGKTYDQIILTLGYPKASNLERQIILPWKGFVQKWIFHEHFGLMPVHVFAIDVRH